ncbi:MAG: leucine-rich repeat protein [Lachnospiraceae bacterium]|nr:leucine-rich repeat protein [Lachnospiraceae bacterium]
MGKFFNRAIAVVLTASLLFSGGISSDEASASSKNTSENTSNKNISNKVDREEDSQLLIDGEDIKRNNGYIDSKRDLSYLVETQKYLNKKNKKSSNGLLCATDEDELPAKFDLRDEGLVSPVVDQGETGTCWVQTIAAGIENALIEQNPTVRINPYQISAAVYQDEDNEILISSSKDGFENDDPLYHYEFGGNSGVADFALLSGKSPVIMDEKYREDETKAVKIYEDSELVADYQVDSIDYGGELYIQNAESRDYEIDAIKSLICNDKRTVFLSYNADYTTKNVKYYNPETNAQYCDEKTDPNHAVTVVGWDDNFSKENFKEGCQPENDGAWIIKNSWGTYASEDGYFYLSYEDKTQNYYNSYVVNFSDNDDYEGIYSYDDFGWGTSLSSKVYVKEEKSPKNGYGANVYVAENDEEIEYVGFYTTDLKTDYSISVYTGVEDGEPESGECAIDRQEGSSNTCGYKRVKLNKPVKISKGEKFSVVVYFDNAKYRFPIPAESLTIVDADDESNFDKYGSRGESFISSDGKEWTDIQDIGHEMNGVVSGFTDYKCNKITNLCIMAYTNKLNSDGEAASSVNFSELEGMLAKGTEIKLSACDGDKIYYCIDDGEYQEYTEPIVFNDDCEISAYAVTDGNLGNVKTKKYTVADSMLSDLEIVTDDETSFTHMSVWKDNEMEVEGVLGETFNVRAFGTDTITVDGEEVSSNELSQDYTFTDTEQVITVKSTAEGKNATTYKFTVIGSIEPTYCYFDYEDEIIDFDDESFDVYFNDDEQLEDGQSVTEFVDSKNKKKELYIYNEGEKDKNKKKLAVEELPERYEYGDSVNNIDYENEVLNDLFSEYNIWSFNEDMSDATTADFEIPVEPGRDIYLQYVGNDNIREFSSIPLRIQVPKRPEAKVDEEVEAGIKVSGDILTMTLKKGHNYYFIENEDIENLEIFDDIEKEMYIRLEEIDKGKINVMYSDVATDESFESEPINLEYEIDYDKDIVEYQEVKINLVDNNTNEVVAEIIQEVNQYYNIVSVDDIELLMPPVFSDRSIFDEGQEDLVFEFDEAGKVIQPEEGTNVYVNLEEGYGDFEYDIVFYDLDGNLIETSTIKNDKIGYILSSNIDCPKGYKYAELDYDTIEDENYNCASTLYLDYLNTVEYYDSGQENKPKDENVDRVWRLGSKRVVALVEESDEVTPSETVAPVATDNPTQALTGETDSQGKNQDTGTQTTPSTASSATATAVQTTEDSGDSLLNTKFAKKGIVYKITSFDKSSGNGDVVICKVKKKKQKKLKSVTIKNTVKYKDYKFTIKKINKKVFSKCKKLKKVTFKTASVIKIGKKAFKGVKESAKYYVPSKLFKKYKKALKKAGAKGEIYKN